MSKLSLAWAWLKKNWHWVVLPVGAALYLLGRAGRKAPVVSPALVQHFEVQHQAEQEAGQQAALATIARDKKIQRLNQDHDQVIQRLKEADARTAEALKDDPIALSRFLNQVNQDVEKG